MCSSGSFSSAQSCFLARRYWSKGWPRSLEPLSENLSNCSVFLTMLQRTEHMPVPIHSSQLLHVCQQILASTPGLSMQGIKELLGKPCALALQHVLWLLCPPRLLPGCSGRTRLGACIPSSDRDVPPVWCGMLGWSTTISSSFQNGFGSSATSAKHWQ